MNAKWNEAEDAMLRSNWMKPGCSAAKLALVLGRTRNAVAGRAHRLGLSMPKSWITRPQGERAFLP